MRCVSGSESEPGRSVEPSLYLLVVLVCVCSVGGGGDKPNDLALRSAAKLPQATGTFPRSHENNVMAVSARRGIFIMFGENRRYTRGSRPPSPKVGPS